MMRIESLSKEIAKSIEQMQESTKIPVKLKRSPRKTFWGLHLYRLPMALTSDQFSGETKTYSLSWEKWRAKIRGVCPIQFWVRETLYDFLHFWFVHYRKEKYYELKCWLFPYNVLRIKSLPRTWTDERELLAHAMFAVLERYMNSNPSATVDFTHDAEHRKFWREINKVWTWWQKREEREKLLTEALDEAHNRPKHWGYRAKYGKYNTLERKFDTEEKKMLARILKWRDYLWV